MNGKTVRISPVVETIHWHSTNLPAERISDWEDKYLVYPQLHFEEQQSLFLDKIANPAEMIR